jgi:hypothetical protein
MNSCHTDGSEPKTLTGMARRKALCLLTMAALVGCSHTCTPAATVGIYSMKAAADTYDLNLAKNGSGSISRNGQAESITWEWANQQVFLHVSRELLEDLGKLIGHQTPSDAAGFRSGYFGLDPKCHAGRATELSLGEGGASFSRIN